MRFLGLNEVARCRSLGCEPVRLSPDSYQINTELRRPQGRKDTPPPVHTPFFVCWQKTLQLSSSHQDKLQQSSQADNCPAVAPRRSTHRTRVLNELDRCGPSSRKRRGSGDHHVDHYHDHLHYHCQVVVQGPTTPHLRGRSTLSCCSLVASGPCTRAVQHERPTRR